MGGAERGVLTRQQGMHTPPLLILHIQCDASPLAGAEPRELRGGEAVGVGAAPSCRSAGKRRGDGRRHPPGYGIGSATHSPLAHLKKWPSLSSNRAFNEPPANLRKPVSVEPFKYYSRNLDNVFCE